jgi:hypothetical protein
MKKSKRYIGGTILAGYAGMVLFIGLNRLYVANVPEPLPERTSAAELAGLRNFTAVEVRGDFSLELVREADYSVNYVPLSDTRGQFLAALQGSTLVLTGFGNRTQLDSARVRVGMPELLSLEASSAPTLLLADFAGETMDLRLTVIGTVTLRNNSTTNLRVVASGVRELQLDAISFAGSELRITGNTAVTQVD